jgi:hypothetical protein
LVIMIAIAVIAAAMGGLIAGLKIALLFLPFLFIAKMKNKKDLFLLLFLVYALAIGYEFEIANIYGADLPLVLCVVTPQLLLLDSGLRDEHPLFAKPKIIFPLIISVFVFGWFVNAIFVGAVLIALAFEFSGDKARRGIFAAVISLALLIGALALVQGVLNLEGGAATQVVFIAAFSTLTALVFFWKHIDRQELWH